MKAYDTVRCPVVKRAQLTADTFDFILACPALVRLARPGQFAQIRIPGHTLRRPISICGIDTAAGTLRFVFQIRGQGTQELSCFRVGDEVEILAPLGKGFPDLQGQRVLLVGGGIGVPPLLGAAARLREDAVALLGFRTKDAVILEEDFRKTGAKVLIATDDGSYGCRGLVTELAAAETFDAVFSCGPLPMLRAVKALAAERGVPCWLSLEERMACGIGACLGCAVPLLGDGGAPYFGHVCRDGPVFDSRILTL